MSKGCGVITKIDIGNDHRMVRARIKLNSRLERLRRIKRKRPIKINTEILEMHKEQFQLGISNRFNALEEKKPTLETFHKIMEEEAERFGKNGKDKPNEKLEEDMEIERLDENSKHSRKERQRQLLKKIEYTELNKLVKKKRRARQRRKRKEGIEKIIVNGIGPKKAYK
ncbi:endonuclease-reverse transcriptase [Plakobranchus ocellatus]|uniref:Endonuclease-reverse transcriptase n=1 Tax=Plakobranchus ocellatus TaxID=259542 RepID=A0AAV3Y7W3_9GAST|nr:endonuclease-reverse transcriptase [Plakobranchus ocellatus]